MHSQIFPIIWTCLHLLQKDKKMLRQKSSYQSCPVHQGDQICHLWLLPYEYQSFPSCQWTCINLCSLLISSSIRQSQPWAQNYFESISFYPGSCLKKSSWKHNIVTVSHFHSSFKTKQSIRETFFFFFLPMRFLLMRLNFSVLYPSDPSAALARASSSCVLI